MKSKDDFLNFSVKSHENYLLRMMKCKFHLYIYCSQTTIVFYRKTIMTSRNRMPKC